MSIFNLFSRHPQTPSAPEEKSRPPVSSKKSSQEPEPDQRSDHSKARHLRRDQVFVAIREAMTRTGILSTNYKFKVLSEDPQGNDFMVMMTLNVVTGEPLPALGEMEMAIMESALVRFQIIVSAVYWRMTEIAPVAKFVPPPVAAAAVRAATQAAQPTPAAKPPKSQSPHETIEADEVIAFQQALVAASAQSSPMPKEKSPPRRRSNQPKDFQDTEMVDSSVVPVLSKTQYGDL